MIARRLSGGVLLLCCVLGACTSFPEAGPGAGDIVSEAASATVPAGSMPYALVDIDDRVAGVLEARRPESLAGSFGDRRGSAEPRIGIGDGVMVTVWEAAAGGLFSAPLATDRFSTGSKSATIPEQPVGRDGSITVPYAGRVSVAGRRPQDVEAAIVRALDGKAIQPQALIQVTRPASQSVTVGGEVGQGARVPLNPRGDRLLDVLAQAGGPRAPVSETVVRLSRDGRTLAVPLSRVVADPRENIAMLPGDVLTLVREPMAFQAFGATGRNAEIAFEAEGISLSQALAKAAGLQDQRADPAGVFLFRWEDPAMLHRLPPGEAGSASSPAASDPSAGGTGSARGGAGAGRTGAPVPVVYRLNLRTPASLFLAQRVPMRNKDVLYVSNAPLTDLEKALRIFNLVASPAGTAASISTAVK